MIYVQRKDGKQLETVDEFTTRKEGRAMLAEYRMADPSAHHYLSSRPCKDWKDSHKEAADEPSAEDSNVPNLDDDASIDLMAFWKRHQNGRAYLALFPQGGKGTKKATADLANYASNKHAARYCRISGDIQSAQIYENICQRLYDGLPESAQW